MNLFVGWALPTVWVSGVSEEFNTFKISSLLMLIYGGLVIFSYDVWEKIGAVSR
jgi:hypothetical protein